VFRVQLPNGASLLLYIFLLLQPSTKAAGDCCNWS